MSKSVTKRQMVTGVLDCVRRSGSSYLFVITGTGNTADSGVVLFFQNEKKAAEWKDLKGKFPLGSVVRVSGRFGETQKNKLLYPKIHTIGGLPAVSYRLKMNLAANRGETFSLSKASDVSQEHDDKVEAIKNKPKPETVTYFPSVQNAFERGAAILRKQVRLKDPKLTTDEVVVLWNAFNRLKAELKF